MQQLVEMGLLAKPVSLTRFLYQVPLRTLESSGVPWFLLSLGVGGLILLLSSIF